MNFSANIFGKHVRVHEVLEYVTEESRLLFTDPIRYARVRLFNSYGPEALVPIAHLAINHED